MGIADKDYYTDADKQLVDEGDENAAFLLIRKGQEVPAEMADKYGIGKVAQPEGEAEEKAAKPSADKSAAPTKNKGAK